MKGTIWKGIIGTLHSDVFNVSSSFPTHRIYLLLFFVLQGGSYVLWRLWEDSGDGCREENGWDGEKIKGTSGPASRRSSAETGDHASAGALS